ncbi:MAG: glutamate--tRNA ligase [Ignavibacteria bacterium GWB2_35_12]|nr:MAG: glutamate--tRNA ligase [Ignavibacteria bacterium GWA2_35_8]OGU42519.1 MAG: glutamate--tRNA ligase [Ignavibacteria bacterium GWB2_35_12]OGV19102.1 MAG: glutamate--tRNA ligase [Ignavibacteria bacterium RIFOXYC2_FULL_35_21]
MSVRVRFAPSPTGFLHVGGLRTALYNYLFARHHKGTYVLRIEDTDRTRLVENAVENLIKSLKWAGIDYDEGPGKGGDYAPYIQSERLSIYKEYADILHKKGAAYYAFDTTEEIDEMRKRNPGESFTKYDRTSMKNEYTLGEEESKKMVDSGTSYVLRLKVPDSTTVVFDDLIRGKVEVSTNEIDDQVLMKSDGFPTYHLANVVDDHLMKITHVIRGEEWLPSTPKHVLLYHAFGWEKPLFAHLPLLLNPDKSKLSKRQGSVAVEDFASEGYFSDAIVNFVALLGWNPSSDREIYTIDELIESFDIEKVNKGGAVFDRAKLEWMNFQYLKLMPANELADILTPILEAKGITGFQTEYLEKVINLFRERIKFVKEIPEIAGYMFSSPQDFEQEYLEKHWKGNTVEILEPLLDKYKATGDFSHSALYELTKSYIEGLGKKLKEIIHPIRLMLTGKSAGAGMFETMEVLGKDECIKRIEEFIKIKETGKI